jgi:hypothetical protein
MIQFWNWKGVMSLDLQSKHTTTYESQFTNNQSAKESFKKTPNFTNAQNKLQIKSLKLCTISKCGVSWLIDLNPKP